jgi:EAL domain-containing protein (putative c-di-GMP-specific phosphodiesterase class I)
MDCTDCNETSSSIIKATMALAGSMKHEFIAEGVVNDAQMEVLKQLGCYDIQGIGLAGRFRT